MKETKKYSLKSPDQFTRIGEYIGLSRLKLNTLQGSAYIFVAVDGFSEYGYNLGVEKSDDPALVVRFVYELTEHNYFVQHQDRSKGFTLVLEEFEDQAERIRKVISSMNGKVVINKSLNNKIMQPLLVSIAQQIKRSGWNV
jgi:hypothetical protein